ncbi:negative regulator of flagellin synthesis FlgM [Clostridium tetanomorphum]|uniref:Flagellar biosynthesis anti-sigma factor FlgM n=1 Tax=Clostridium tetanomorphum TaxID=1553 RepID=A0A923ECC1_CLOTT|nr:flagellar biosynthesis anti-sigma factor FlgM [Clostridium tetanomorphum]KAJ53496.1 negative regulator of flagellin synthesis [Clostridium tetanomorphum DSM 665]MBC2398429.1 flagellar biosynthesis anti-sigma factor FlgM [Clostridium tetanomorphum]MBP1865271.1 negative regulator of flagellin synthesis FlgM [Clostridium tetanomorphum]NRS85194.1 negative regulator of flagellin synthesis FlgM [Clostridium tetanomorphum]NRZ98373.1 negative regulator of flagellin synthesis FlgM [Clostridium tetan
MKVNGISANKVLSLYGDSKKRIENKNIKKESNSDQIQISSLGKSLSSYSIDDKLINSKERLEKIRGEISKGTYNRDSRLVAQSIIDAMKNKE